MFGVVYCADFYIQCERLFRPELIGRGLLVTSSGEIGDDPIIASSREARDLGLKPGLVGDELRLLFSQITEKHTINVCRPNYELYADISSRFIKSLELLAPNISACASNEAVLALKGLKLSGFQLPKDKKSEDGLANLENFNLENFNLENFNLNDSNLNDSNLNDLELNNLEPNNLDPSNPYYQYAIHLKHTLKQWLGISVFVGIATTKTLAKLACDAAETHDEYEGVIALSSGSECQLILKRIAVADVAGISKKVANRLSQINIHTALDLSQALKSQVRRHSSMIIERIAIELSGLPCKTPVQNLIGVSGSTVSTQINIDSFKQLKHVLNAQVASAVEKLNSLSSNCKTVTLALTITPLDKQNPAFENSLSSKLAKPTDSIAAIRKLATQLLESVWRDGYQYQSLKLNLAELSANDGDQIGLFPATTESTAIDANRDPPKSISFETHLSFERTDQNQHKRSLRTSSFTTRWGDIARVS